MSQRALTLPIRSFARTAQAPWTCRRCLATQAEAVSSSPDTPPSGPRIKNYDEVDNYDPSIPASKRDYRLNKTDFYLKKPLPQTIPTQYLQHSTSDLLHENERAQREDTKEHKEIVGVVVSTGKMHKTVKVRVPGQKWNKRVKKYYPWHDQHLVRDPNSSLVEGDVVRLHRLHVSTAVFHVVAAIVSPFGKPISERPPVPTADERLAMYKEHRFAKLHRRSLRRRAAMGEKPAIAELRAMGLDPGAGVEEGAGQTVNTEKGVGKKRTPDKGAILGAKGQKLPEGVLPGGKQATGKIQERARSNKGKAMKMDEKAEENLLEAKQKGEKLRAKQGIEADSVVPEKGSV